MESRNFSVGVLPRVKGRRLNSLIPKRPPALNPILYVSCVLGLRNLEAGGG